MGIIGYESENTFVSFSTIYLFFVYFCDFCVLKNRDFYVIKKS